MKIVYMFLMIPLDNFYAIFMFLHFELMLQDASHMKGKEKDKAGKGAVLVRMFL